MKNIMKMVLLVVLIAGCGGGGGDDGNGGSVTNSPFAGVYSGTFEFSGDGGYQNGTLTINIGTNGHYTTSAHNNYTGANATGSGSAANNGEVNGTFTEGENSYNYNGTISKESDGEIIGSLNEYYGSTFMGILTFEVQPGH